jgi:hypothetical protein
MKFKNDRLVMQETTTSSVQNFIGDKKRQYLNDRGNPLYQHFGNVENSKKAAATKSTMPPEKITPQQPKNGMQKRRRGLRAVWASLQLREFFS